MKWFRFYSEVIHDPKVQKMPIAMRWRWAELLSLANEGIPRGVIPSPTDVAYILRITEKQAQQNIVYLLDRHLLDRDEAGNVRPHNWDKRQLDTDALSESGAIGNHRRWHVGRGIAEPACPYCLPDVVPESPANREEDKRRLDKEESRGEGEEDAPAQHPFAFTYAHEYRQRHKRQVSQVEHAAALALEREYGADACLQVARDFDWQKHPNYLKPILEERRTKALTAAAVAGPTWRDRT